MHLAWKVTVVYQKESQTERCITAVEVWRLDDELCLLYARGHTVLYSSMITWTPWWCSYDVDCKERRVCVMTTCTFLVTSAPLPVCMYVCMYVCMRAFTGTVLYLKSHQSSLITLRVTAGGRRYSISPCVVGCSFAFHALRFTLHSYSTMSPAAALSVVARLLGLGVP